MYAIKMDADKSLVTTVHTTIYRGENNADTLVFLIPQMYEDIDMSACTLLLRYVLPDGTGKSEELDRVAAPYNNDYYKYRLKVSSKFTEASGDVELWLTAIGFSDEAVLKTGTTIVEISTSKNIAEYIPSESLDQLDRLTAQMKQLERNKADGISYNMNSNILQLTSNGEPVGDAVVVGEASDGEAEPPDDDDDTPDSEEVVDYGC